MLSSVRIRLVSLGGTVVLVFQGWHLNNRLSGSLSHAGDCRRTRWSYMPLLLAGIADYI